MTQKSKKPAAQAKVEKTQEEASTTIDVLTPFAEQMRSVAEQSMAATKTTYDQSRQKMEDVQQSVEEAITTTQKVGQDFTKTALDMGRGFFDIQAKYFEALVGAKSISEIVEIQTSAIRTNAEAALKNASDFQTASTKAIEETSKPFTSLIEESVKGAKAA